MRSQASTEPDAVRGAELVLFSVKSTDTEAAGKAMAPYLGAIRRSSRCRTASTTPSAWRQRSAARSFPPWSTSRSRWPAPATCATTAAASWSIGRASASEAIVAAFAAAGVKVEISDNVAGALWAKLIVNSAYNALSAITQLPYGRLVAERGRSGGHERRGRRMPRRRRASGVQLPGDMHETVRRIAQTMPGQYSSTAQDLARTKKTEIEHLNGFVVRKGEALGVRTPVNRVLLALVKALESRPT